MSLPTPTVQGSTPKQHVSLRRRSQSSLGAGCTPNKARCVTPSTKSLGRHARLKGVTLGILTPSIIWMYHTQHELGRGNPSSWGIFLNPLKIFLG